MKWKVIEAIPGRVAAISSPEAEFHPDWRMHEQLVWEGQAAKPNDALLKAALVEPRLDIQQRRLRHEVGLSKINVRTGRLFTDASL